MDTQSLKTYLVLGVALITWGAFFFYLLRLSAMARRLENEVRAAEEARLETSRAESASRAESERSQTPVA